MIFLGVSPPLCWLLAIQTVANVWLQFDVIRKVGLHHGHMILSLQYIQQEYAPLKNIRVYIAFPTLSL